RLDDRRRERLGDVADAEPDHLGVGVRGLIRADAPTDLGEQVARGQLGVVLVDAGHRGGTYSVSCAAASCTGADTLLDATLFALLDESLSGSHDGVVSGS